MSHGVYTCYTKGCRRPECREAFRVYYRAWRARRRAAGLPTQGRKGKHVRPPRDVPAPSSAGAAAFVERTDPLVLQAIRRVFNGHSCDTPRCPHMPMREREALDAWLNPRVEALVEILAGERERVA